MPVIDWGKIKYGSSYRAQTSRPRPRAMQAPTIRGGADPAALSALQKATSYYEPGGGFGAGTEAALERGETRAVASGAQSLVSAGLASTTMIGGLGKKYQEEVGMPTRARVEETRAGALSGLQVLKAQIIQGATESARSRALQQYMAQLQSGTSLALGSARTPSLTQIPGRAPTATPTATQTPIETKQPMSLFGTGAGGGRFPEVGPVLEPAIPDMYQSQFDVSQWFKPGGWMSNAPQRGPGEY